MADRALNIRLSVKDAETAVRALEQFGGQGSRAISQIRAASVPASRGLLALSAATGEVRGSIERFAAGAGGLGVTLRALGPAGLAAAAGIGGAVIAARQFNQAVSQADAIGKFADRIGVSTAALQELRFAAERSGIAQGTLDQALQGFTRRVAEAVEGTGELRATLEQYGIALRDSNGRTRDNLEVLGDLADVIASTTDESERLRIAVKAFESEGAGLVNLLSEGSAAMDDLRARARDLGLVLSEETIREAERTRDALDTFGQVIGTNVNRVLLDLAPIAADASEALAELFALFRSGGAAAIPSTLGEIEERIVALGDELVAAQNKAERASGQMARAMRADVADLRKQIADLNAARAELLTGESDAANAAISGDLGISAEAYARARSALADLRQEIDATVKIEAERAEKLAELEGVLEILGVTEQEHAEIIAELNAFFDAKLDALTKNTAATKEQAAADAEAARAAAEYARENERLSSRLDALDARHSGAAAALIEYRDTLEDLNAALRRGLLDEEEHSDRVDRAAAAYTAAANAARTYEIAAANASATASRVSVPQFDGRGLLDDIGRAGVGAITSGSFDPRSFAINTIGSRVGDFVLDRLLEGDGIGSIVSNVGSRLVDAVSGIGSSISQSLASSLPALGNAIGQAIGISQGLGPAGLLTGGLGPGGAGGAVASQIAGGGLAQAGFAAALPGIGIALAGLALLATKIFGPGKSSGPAIGTSFEVDDGGLAIRSIGADNGADVEGARQIGDGIVEVVDRVLDAIGGRLLPGAFAGEVGFANGRFANAISSPGIAPGDGRSGRSPDLRTFADGDAAVADFVVRSMLDALERGLVDGVTETTRGVFQSVLGRLEADGGATVEAVGAALDFAASFEEATDRMLVAGDAAAQQLLTLEAAARAAGDSQEQYVRDFLEQAETFFGATSRPRGGIDGAGRVDVSNAVPILDESGEVVGFTLNGDDYRYGRISPAGDEFTEYGFRNETTGATISEPTLERALETLARGGVRADGSEGAIADPGDPENLARARAAINAYVDDLLGLTDDAQEPLAGFALSLTAGLEALEQMRGTLEALGLTADEVDAKLAEAETALRSQTAEDFDEEIADRLTALTNPAALAIEQLVDGFAALREQALAVGGDEDALGELEVETYGRALRELLDSGSSVEGLAEILGELGVSAGDASVFLEAAQGAIGAIAGGAAGLASDLRARAIGIASPRAGQLAAITAEYERNLSALAGTGEGTAAADAVFALSVANLARQEEAAAIEQSIELRAGEISLLEQSTGSLEALVTSIRRTREDFRVDRSLSPLSPTQSLAEARALFEAARDAGLGGDEDEAQRALELGRTVLELGRFNFASGPEYADLFAEIDGGLSALEGSFQSELSVQRSQLDELRLIRAELEETREGLATAAPAASPSTSLDGLRRLADGQYTNAAGYDFGFNPAAAVAINEALIAAGLDPISGFGEGQANDRRATDPLVDAILRARGFASGGDHGGGFRFVGERGIELEATGPSRIFSATDTARAFAAGGAAAAMTTDRLEAVVDEVARMGRAIDGLVAFLGGLAHGRGGGGYGFGSV